MSTAEDRLTDMVEQARASWKAEDDPVIIELPGERQPVVAAVEEDRLHVIHSGTVYARTVSVEQILDYLDEEGGTARLGRLSEHSDRFDRDDLLELHPEADDA